MFATILAAISAFLADIPIIRDLLVKYFPAKATETKIEEGSATIDQNIADEESTGRPK